LRGKPPVVISTIDPVCIVGGKRPGGGDVVTTKVWQHPENRTEPAPRNVNAGGAVILDLVGIAAILLGIFGLARVMPIRLDGIAVIVLGAGMVLVSILFLSSLNATLGLGTEDRQAAKGSFTAELILGLAAVVLGIFALATLRTLGPLGIGVVILGVALWTGSVGETRMGLAGESRRSGERIAPGRIIGMNTVIGIGAIVLGILALLHLSPRLLTLISITAMGVALLMTGSYITRRTVRAAA
jgi:hypothetical protein